MFAIIVFYGIFLVLDPLRSANIWSTSDIVAKLIGLAVSIVLINVILSKKLRNQYDTYSLVVDAEHLEYEEFKVPNTRIYFKDIKEILQKPDGNLIIKHGANAHLFVPAEIEQPQQLKELLNAHVPIQSIPLHFLEKHWYVSSIITVALCTLMLLSTHMPIILASLGALMLFVLYRYFYGEKHHLYPVFGRKRLFMILGVYMVLALFRLSMIY